MVNHILAWLKFRCNGVRTDSAKERDPADDCYWWTGKPQNC